MIDSQIFFCHNTFSIFFEDSIMIKGKVKWFDAKKGYGFITAENGEDVFVHYSDIDAEGYKTLREDDEVEFEISEGKKGLKAVNVKPL